MNTVFGMNTAAHPLILYALKSHALSDLDERSSDPVGRSFALAQLALYTAPSEDLLE
jgi:hypothetical protein